MLLCFKFSSCSSSLDHQGKQVCLTVRVAGQSLDGCKAHLSHSDKVSFCDKSSSLIH